MKNRSFKLTSSALGLCLLALIFSSGANAFPGTRGPNTPGYITAPGVTPDTDNTVGGHLMRMQNGAMNPNGMLMQHHFQHSGTDGDNPYPIFDGGPFGGTAGIRVDSGAEAGASQVTVQVSNFVDPLDRKQMRVEILAFDDAADNFATVNSVTATDPNPTTVTQTGSFTQADLLFNGVVWDYSYFDFLITPNPDWEEIVIDANGANIAQIFVWTVSEPVPIPAAVWLFGTALTGLLGISRKRNSAVQLAA